MLWKIQYILTSFLLTVGSITDCLKQDSLRKIYVSNATKTGAICNDYSTAIYYLHHNRNSSNWVIYLEGGGSCSTITECERRFASKPYLMTSVGYPNIIQTRSILSADIFASYSKVIIPYCSSDLWLGHGDYNRNGTGGSFDRFTFRGAAIFEAVVSELESLGLEQSEHVVLIGSSAGGIGVLNHVNFLTSRLKIAKISLLMDSSWFINFNGFFKTSNNGEFLKHTGILKQAGCTDYSQGFPCCLSAACMLAKSYVSKDVPKFVISGKYDIFSLLRELLPNNYAENSLRNKDFFFKIHSLGGAMLESLNAVKTSFNFNYIFTSCFQHGYLMSSTLWGKVYNSNMEFHLDSLNFIHNINEANWFDLKVNGALVQSIVTNWLDAVNSDDRRNASSVQITDLCERPQCNPSCPQLIYIDYHQSNWESWKKIALLFVIIFIVASCLLVKCFWLIQHHHLKQTQSMYLDSNYEDEDLDKIMCLPTCPPHSSIGISCSMLQYDIMIPSQPMLGTLKRNEAARQRKISIGNIRRKPVFFPGKRIIKGITAYFNPGQLVAIMGPSGAGKTTLLDILTARKTLNQADANIFINGLPAEETRDWFIKNSGYVLQLATPYHEELTVRQNLTYTAMMRLPMKMKITDKMWRVEQVLGQCGLYEVADVVVGGNAPGSGGGLSGGQKRRLCIALQLLDLPSVLFLDEPTSGLDSSSSLELLETLHGLTLSGRLVVVTIHQPRIEIFHMFDAILILCGGQTAYFGSPIVAPMMIAEALQGSDQVFDASNPADTIMDVLTNSDSQKSIVGHYQNSGEIEAIDRAIQRAKRHPQKTLSMKFQKQTSSIQNRLLALDGRSSASQTLSQRLYFSLVFLLYSLSLGTCYWKTEEGVLLMSCYMVFSCASQLFMASVIHAHLSKAFALFSLEKSDGVGHSHELVLHVFIRVFSQASLPLVVACAVIFLCTMREYVWWKFCVATLIHLQLNQTWIALIMFMACLTPRYSPFISPLLSAIAGFAGGFLVPAPQMPIFYSWLFYINPTYWAYSGMVKALLSDVSFECQWKSPLECQANEGIMILQQFGFNQSNPFTSMTVLLFMLFSLLVLAIAILEVKYSKRQWRKLKSDYLSSFRLRFASCFPCFNACFEYRKRRKMNKIEERDRLFKLAEEKYTYKALTEEKVPGSTSHTVHLERYDSKRRSQSFTDAETVDSTNSSNDEDEDPTVTAHPKKSPKNTMTALLNKLQTSVSSGLSIKGRSNTNSSQSTTGTQYDSVKFRHKNGKARKWKQLISNRRKTFTGVLEENEGIPPETSLERPRSLLLPKLNSTPSYLQNGNDNTKENFSEARYSDKFNNDCALSVQLENDEAEPTCEMTQMIPETVSFPKLSPPDIVIDIERKDRPEEEQIKTEDSVFSSGNERESPRKRKDKKRKKRHRKENKTKDTWSKYLDTNPRRHEVYCALNSVKKRLKGKERMKERLIMKKQTSITLQRNASMQILEGKRRSLRDQLCGLQSSFNAADYSPNTRKRLQMLRTRNKYRGSTQSNEYEARKMDTDDEGMSSCCSSKRASKSEEKREMLERLTNALSSQRSSRSSGLLHGRLESKRNEHDIVVGNDKSNGGTERMTSQIFNVLQKLNSFDQTHVTDDELDGLNDRVDYGFLGENRHRDSDPLLPQEREIIEQLLYKYAQSHTPVTPHERHSPLDQKFSFSSNVKIRASPGHSRKSSVDQTRPSANFQVSNNMSHVMEEREDFEDGSKIRKSSAISPKIKRRSFVNDEGGDSDGDGDDDDEQFGERGAFDDKDGESKNSKEEVGSTDSSSSDEEEILKTHEGFIIPKESISKIMGSGVSPITVGLKLRRESRSQEEEIERQFKRENFLKDRPVRRGIRMPTGSVGKVNLLKSRFESRNLGAEKPGSAKFRRSLEKLNATNSGSKTNKTSLFRILRTKASSSEMDCISEHEMESVSIHGGKETSTTQATNK